MINYFPRGVYILTALALFLEALGVGIAAGQGHPVYHPVPHFQAPVAPHMQSHPAEGYHPGSFGEGAHPTYTVHPFTDASIKPFMATPSHHEVVNPNAGSISAGSLEHHSASGGGSDHGGGNHGGNGSGSSGGGYHGSGRGVRSDFTRAAAGNSVLHPGPSSTQFRVKTSSALPDIGYRSTTRDTVSRASATQKPGITAKNGTQITGFKQHGVDRAIGDTGKRAGTRPEAILDAVKNPKKVRSGIDKDGRPYQMFTGKNARVLANPDTGKIFSVNPLSGAGAHK